MANIQDIKAKESQLKQQGAVITPGAQQGTPTSTKQIGSAGSNIGAGSVAGIQQISFIQPQQQKTPTTEIKQSGQAQVGTGAVAGMPNQLPNFYEMSNQPVDKQAEIEAIRAGATKQTNTQNNIGIQTPKITPTSTKTTSGVGVTPIQQNNGRDYSLLRNADINLSQYGDDSSAQNYNNQELWGGENQKYTGEGVKTSNVNYDPNATLENLDPNYQYGWNAQLANSNDAGYIARRNDTIASALYNAGLTSIEDVRNFLNTQKGFQDSEVNERENTIQSVWKRLGEIQGQQGTPGQQEQQKEQNSIDESALVEDTSGKIYGKVTAETGQPSEGITTLADENNIYTKMQEARVANVNALRSMDPAAAAALTHSGTTPYGETTMRDIQSLDPNWYKQYNTELKKLYTQDSVDKITSGEEGEESKSFVDSNDEQIENDIKTFEEKNTSDEFHEGASGMLNNLLKSNKVAGSAKQEMLNIKKDIADLNSELEDLPNQAEKIFKGDVPEYLVQAYISNNSQKLQKKIQNLENRYSSLSDMYKTEVSQAQREAEYQLKMAEYQRALTNDAYDREYKNNKLLQDSVQRVNGVPFSFDAKTRSYMQLDDNTASYQYNTKVGIQSQWGQSLVGKKTGLECEGYTDMQSNATAGVTMVGANGGATTAAEKVAYATNGGYVDKDGNIVYGNSNISDLIPQVGDIGVMISNGSNGVSEKRGHTVYVDAVRNENGETMIHYTATNLGSTPDKYTVGYERTVSLSDFMANGGVGFWNPYKQAQYNGQSTTEENIYSPMQPTIDRLMEEYRNSGKTNLFSELGKFQEIYTNLWKADKNGELSAVLDQGGVGTFLDNVALAWAQDQGGDSQIVNGSAIERFMGLSVGQALAAATEYVAQHKYDEKAYAGFLTMMRAVEIKLRDESGAAINQSEWATNFLLNLPKAADTDYVKSSKLERLGEYVRRLGTDAGITSKEYIPLTFGVKSRIYD